jgi:hypothetical protein
MLLLETGAGIRPGNTTTEQGIMEGTCSPVLSDALASRLQMLGKPLSMPASQVSMQHIILHACLMESSSHEMK